MWSSTARRLGSWDLETALGLALEQLVQSGGFR